MALTIEVEQKLQAVELTAFFEAHRITWQDAAQRAYSYVRQGAPLGATIRHDDVATALLIFMKANVLLQRELNRIPLRQQFWFKYFTDYVVAKTWDDLKKDANT